MKKQMVSVMLLAIQFLDNLLPFKDACEYTNKVLVTLHRRENHDLMNEWF